MSLATWNPTGGNNNSVKVKRNDLAYRSVEIFQAVGRRDFLQKQNFYTPICDGSVWQNAHDLANLHDRANYHECALSKK